jgi:predicted MFS family arabinose efflux permease
MAALALLTGLASVVVQMLIPYAATLAKDDERASVIGTLMGGLLIGILLSRTFAGFIDGIASWRVVYVVAGVLMLGAAAMLFRALPNHAPELSIGYRAQLLGVLRIARRAPTLRWRSLVGGSAFGAFSSFWTTIAFLLSGPRYHFSDLGIGLFALVGAAGAITAYLGGRIIDARPRIRWPVTGVVSVLLIASFWLIDVGGDDMTALIIGVLLMDACVQGTQLLNQSVIYELLPQAR